MTESGRQRQIAGGRGELERRIADIVAGVTGREVDSSEDELGALGLDSLALLELLAVLEERFQVELTEDIVAEFRSVKRIAEVLRETSKRNSSTGRGVDWGW